MIKVSIIVPVYNTEEYLENCLMSLVSQELEPIEIICIDDASTDNSYNILKKFSNKYNNIHIFHNDTNQGQGITRNIGISLAKGKYIGFVDSDDFVSNKMYSRLYNEAESNNYPEVVSTGISFVKSDNVLRDTPSLGRGRLYHLPKDKEKIISQSPSACNKIFLRESLSNLRFLEKTMWEDVAFTYSAIINSENLLVMNSCDYFYRRDITKGVSSKGYKINPHLSDVFKVCDFLEDNAKKQGKFDIYKEEIRLIQFSSCINRIEEISKWENISHLDKEKLMQDMINLMLDKYGSLDQVDRDILSSRANIFLLESFSLKNKKAKGGM